MSEKSVLHLRNLENPYHELALILIPHREREQLSVEFIVEGSPDNPLVGIRYPGKKVMRRNIDSTRRNVIRWANLLDFLVVPYQNKRELNPQNFTFDNLIEDFYENKLHNDEFWKCVEDVYYHNTLPERAPKADGIEPLLFLAVLKWIWIQEDLNYRFSWREIDSPVKYILQSARGKRMSKGAGRAKFFGALILLRHDFTLKVVRKIIPMFH